MQMVTDQTLVTNYTRLYTRLCTEGSGTRQNNNTAMNSSAGRLRFGRAAAKLAFVYVCNQ